MKITHCFAAAFAALMLSGCQQSTTQPTASVTQWVDPFIGTDGIVHTFPGATTPFGMIQLSPDGDTKGWNWCSGYHTSDDNIKGFSHNHLSGTGWSDLGDILVAATVGEVQFQSGEKTDPDAGYRSRISHDPDKEKASVGYYMVDLLDYGIKAEMSASQRVGYHRYTYPQTDSANIIIDPNNKIFGQVSQSAVQLLNDSTVTGYAKSNGWGGVRTVWFAARFSEHIKSYKVDGEGMQVFAATFNDPKQLNLKVALSHVSQDGALANLAADGGKSFDTAHAQAIQMWENELGKYQFEGVNDEQMKMLYTGLYHAMIQPNLNQDTDGKYVANGKIEQADGYTNYSTFSFWDTFRGVHPLLTITDHKVTADIVNTLSSRYAKGGHLPLWELLGFDNACMIGYPSVAVMADAIMKDVPSIDTEAAYAAMRDAAFYNNTSSSDGPSGVDAYIKYGYVPAGYHASVSKTMEYAYYDWCIARVAEKLGKKEDAAMFYKRSESFKHHWNPEKGLMWPKDSLGQWVDQSLNSWESLKPHYISGNVWAYTYFFPHANEQAIQMMGGKEQFVANMDKMLTTPLNMEGEQHVDISGFIGQYGHGDEPGHQFLYLYNVAGAAWKIPQNVRQVVKEFYNATRNGMPNNDDCGEMSAWYIFSSMGFYPVCPGDSRYYIGAPLMKSARIKTASGKEFKMRTENFTPENIYVESVTLNGEPLTEGYITHEQIMSGSELVFVMSETPNKGLFGKQ